MKEYTVMGHKTKINPTGIFAGVCGIIVGILLIAFPRFVENILMYCLGGICIVLGLIALIRYFKLDSASAAGSSDMMAGLAWILGGLLVILFKDLLLKLPPLLFGFLIVVGGFYKLQSAFTMKRIGSPRWFIALIPALLSVAVGIVIIIFSRQGTDLLTRFIGCGIVYECACDLIFRKISKKHIDKMTNSGE